MKTRRNTLIASTVAAALTLGVASQAGAVGSWLDDHWTSSRVADVKAELALTPAQAALLAEIHQARQQNLASLLDALEATEAALTAELAKDAPDLTSVAVESEAATNALIAEARANRDRYIALYETLSPSQQDKADALMLARLDRLQRVVAMLAYFAEASTT